MRTTAHARIIAVAYWAVRISVPAFCPNFCSVCSRITVECYNSRHIHLSSSLQRVPASAYLPPVSRTYVKMDEDKDKKDPFARHKAAYKKTVDEAEARRKR
jgi:hypothetical protein